MTSNEKRDFDKEAASWDERPYRVKLAKETASAITRQVTVRSDMDVMDFGCGTGLLTLQLQPLVRSITGVDSSQGMLDILQRKIVELKLTNIETRLVDLDKGDTLAGTYHLIVSNMTLHHVRDIEQLFSRFYNVLAPHGYLCVADLDLEDGQFHHDNTGVFHFGFERKELRTTLEKTGFVDIQEASATEMARQILSGETRTFTVFLMTGQKR